MIIFETATLRNFLSYGNVPTTFYLNKHKNTLIIGANGQGKSAMPDMVCFALYGKAYRNINKTQLVNSINLKHCVVELTFSIGPVSYKVVRGMKPNIFEIYKDGVLIVQEAAVRDYQGYLENQILKISYKTFCQVVVMGSAAFTPFMQLPAAQRRDVIEDVLDISIFSTMNDILRDRVYYTKEEFQAVESSLVSAKKETESQQRVIKILEEAVESRVAEEEAEIVRISYLRRDMENKLAAHQAELDSFVLPEFDSTELQKKTKELAKLEHEIEQIQSRIKKIDSLSDCPTCLQSVDDSHKTWISSKLSKDRHALDYKLVKITSVVDGLAAQQLDLNAKMDQFREIQLGGKTINASIISLSREIERHQTVIANTQKRTGDIKSEKAKLKSIADAALTIIGRKTDLLHERNMQDISVLLLKDTGIKAAIIKEYIPIINRLINKYLGIFGFHVNFMLDENFVETIHSRGRDEFTYNSFSEGEKRKIDVAILFAFRQVTELKNSANCNLLILDEIVDSSLDLNARESFLEILSQEDGNNFVISHTAPSHEAFDAVMKVEKTGDFSGYVYVH